jgi:hypothetical protein
MLASVAWAVECISCVDSCVDFTWGATPCAHCSHTCAHVGCHPMCTLQPHPHVHTAATHVLSMWGATPCAHCSHTCAQYVGCHPMCTLQPHMCSVCGVPPHVHTAATHVLSMWGATPCAHCSHTCAQYERLLGLCVFTACAHCQSTNRMRLCRHATDGACMSHRISLPSTSASTFPTNKSLQCVVAMELRVSSHVH